jgi:hypothetical protein
VRVPARADTGAIRLALWFPHDSDQRLGCELRRGTAIAAW